MDVGGVIGFSRCAAALGELLDPVGPLSRVSSGKGVYLELLVIKESNNLPLSKLLVNTDSLFYLASKGSCRGAPTRPSGCGTAKSPWKAA